MTSTIDSPPIEAIPTAANGANTRKPRKSKPRARTGNVARLPKNVRDSISRMMQDGLSSRAILEKLGPDGKGLNKHHLSEWRTGGFLDWRDDQQWLEEMRAQQQFGRELLEDQGDTKINQIVLQVAITQVLQMLRRIVPANLTTKFDTDPTNFTRLLNSISRISRESLVFRKYDDATARAAIEEIQKRDPDRDLAAQELLMLVNKMDQTFKVARPELPQLLAEQAKAASEGHHGSRSVHPKRDPSDPQSKIETQNSKMDCSPSHAREEADPGGASVPASRGSSRRGPEFAKRTSQLGQQTSGELGKPTETLTPGIATMSTDSSGSETTPTPAPEVQSKIKIQNSKIDSEPHILELPPRRDELPRVPNSDPDVTPEEHGTHNTEDPPQEDSQSKIQTPNSKITNELTEPCLTSEAPSVPACESDVPQSKFKIQKSKITEPPAPDLTPPSESKIQTPNSKITNELTEPCLTSEAPGVPAGESDVPQSKIQNQNSKMAPELCYDCGAELPPLLANGQRPLSSCRACGARLYPSNTKFDQCPYCQSLQPIQAGNERSSPNCWRCRNLLPPVGQRFVTHCPACGVDLPTLTTDGSRASNRCPECRAPVPLLEPSPPPVEITTFA